MAGVEKCSNGITDIANGTPGTVSVTPDTTGTTGSDVAQSGPTAAFRVPTSHEELLKHVNDNRTFVINILHKVLSNECNYANNHPGDADSAKRLANAAMISEKLRYLDGEDWNVTLPREDQQLEHV